MNVKTYVPASPGAITLLTKDWSSGDKVMLTHELTIALDKSVRQMYGTTYVKQHDYPRVAKGAV